MASPCYLGYMEVYIVYVNCLSRNFSKKCIVVFDGYDKVADSTKSHELLK